MANVENNGGESTRRVGNGFDPNVVKGYVDRVERLLDDIESERGSFMAKCKSIREDIALVVQEAKDQHGVPKKEFKAVIKARELEAKAERIRDDLEAESQETFDQIRHALGDLADLPLGAAVLDRASDRPEA